MVRWVRVGLGTTVVAGGLGLAFSTHSDPHSIHTKTQAVVRGARTLAVVAAITADYKISLALAKRRDRLASVEANVASASNNKDDHFSERNGAEYKKVLLECHVRCAQRLLWLCQANAGVYVKVGQQIAALRPHVPEQITSVMASLHDKAVLSTREEVESVFRDQFGIAVADVFADFDWTPIGCASLAQVHRAKLHFPPRWVAVKIQHHHLQHTVDSDLELLEWTVGAVEKMWSDLDLMWLVPLCRHNIKRELDFENEAKNGQKCARMFAGRDWVYVPEVVQKWTGARVLTMELIDGVNIDQTDKIQALGFDPKQVATLFTDAFSHMIFCTGFVHCDPHPGNIMIRRHPTLGSTQIVLLDHGLYRQLQDDVRINFCSLWESVLLQDGQGVRDACHGLGLEEYERLMPIVLIGRHINDNTAMVGDTITREKRLELAREVGHQSFSDVTNFLEALPRDLLFIFRALNLVRVTHDSLGGSRKERFKSHARHAVKGRSYRTFDEDTPALAPVSPIIYLTDTYRSLRFEMRLMVAEWVIYWWRWSRFGSPFVAQ
eukprot:c9821_g1_i1.p1 GENE.c9821_g1_i1~~c9821_g1_i1.p1  ORF type:complete len:549 (-),score=99.49 c9821_g1_i1:133-1779(-)